MGGLTTLQEITQSCKTKRTKHSEENAERIIQMSKKKDIDHTMEMNPTPWEKGLRGGWSWVIFDADGDEVVEIGNDEPLATTICAAVNRMARRLEY